MMTGHEFHRATTETKQTEHLCSVLVIAGGFLLFAFLLHHFVAGAWAPVVNGMPG